MESKIIESKDLPSNEKVYLRKSFDGWRVVHPIKNEDGSYNWFNILTGGSWWRIIFTAIIVLIILGVFYEYSSNLRLGSECLMKMQLLDIT